MTTSANAFVPAAPRVGFGPITKALKAYLLRQQPKRALNNLDDHLMRDIGLPPREKDTHYNLLRVARGPW